MPPDLFNNIWVQAGGIGLLGFILYIVIRAVYRRMSQQENRLISELARRDRIAEAARLEDQKRMRKLEDDRRADIEARFQQARQDTAIVVEALNNCATATHANERSRRKLDRTLETLVTTLVNLPCNAGGKVRTPGTFVTPVPEDTPPSGMETQNEDETRIIPAPPTTPNRVFPGQPSKRP